MFRTGYFVTHRPDASKFPYAKG
ncbi:hypothetical protein ACM25O_09605 [Sulfitobacter pontiacus]